MSILNLQVSVYRNLTKKTLSIKNNKTGKIIGYSNALLLKDVTFKVSEKGRQRVLRTKNKNVHAFISGTLVSIDTSLISNFNSDTTVITYNPYKYFTFVNKITLDPIYTANFCYVDYTGLIIVN